MELIELEDHFTDIGGQFLTSGFDLQKKLANIKAYLFDWDGVFNDGAKHGKEGSDFSEVDSAGLRMLRYGHYKRYGTIPQLGVITGAHNPVALSLMESQQAQVVYQGAIRKGQALEHFLKESGLKAEEVCYVYDDVLDLAVAQKVSMRFCVGRLANPLFLGLVAGSDMADYITASQGNEHAVREICELLLGLMGNYTDVVQEFIGGQSEYAQFKEALSSLKLQSYVYKSGNFDLA
jgi:3-deoxy-D-manno-octulosonate 8-phosphate phosphatase (KDO 8-P phosphatase)